MYLWVESRLGNTFQPFFISAFFIIIVVVVVIIIIVTVVLCINSVSINSLSECQKACSCNKLSQIVGKYKKHPSSDAVGNFVMFQ